MSDIVLKIDTETAKSIQDLVKFAQAQDQAEAATRRGSRAAKDHQKSIDDVGASHSNAANKIKLTANNFSQFAQGTFTSIKQLQSAMPAPDVTKMVAWLDVVKGAPGRLANMHANMDLAKASAFSEALKKGGQEIERLGGHAKETGHDVGWLGEQFGHIGKMALGAFGLVELFDKGKEAVAGYLEYLSKTAETSNKAAGGMRALAAAQDSASASAAAIDTAQSISMSKGITTDDSADLLLSMQRETKGKANKYGEFGNTIDAAMGADEAARLMNLGVGKDTAKQAITGGMQANLTPKQASALAVQTAKNTNMDIGVSAELSQRFSDPMQGSAIMSELHQLGGYKSEKEYKTAIEGAQKGLDADPAQSNFTKKMTGKIPNWANLTETEKLYEIARTNPNMDTKALIAGGMSEQKATEKVTGELMKQSKHGKGQALSEAEARPIARLLAHRDELGRYGSAPDENLAATTEAQLDAIPFLSAEKESRKNDAADSVAKQKGPFAVPARNWEQEQFYRNSRLNSAGMGYLTDNGKPTATGQVAYSVIRQGELSAESQNYQGMAFAPKGVQESLQQNVDKTNREQDLKGLEGWIEHLDAIKTAVVAEQKNTTEAIKALHGTVAGDEQPKGTNPVRNGGVEP